MINRECKTLALPVAFPGGINKQNLSASEAINTATDMI